LLGSMQPLLKISSQSLRTPLSPEKQVQGIGEQQHA